MDSSYHSSARSVGVDGDVRRMMRSPGEAFDRVYEKRTPSSLSPSSYSPSRAAMGAWTTDAAFEASYRVYPAASSARFASEYETFLNEGDRFLNETKMGSGQGSDMLGAAYELGTTFTLPSRPLDARESRKLVADLRMRAKLIAAIPRRPKRSPPAAPRAIARSNEEKSPSAVRETGRAAFRRELDAELRKLGMAPSLDSDFVLGAKPSGLKQITAAAASPPGPISASHQGVYDRRFSGRGARSCESRQSVARIWIEHFEHGRES